MENPIKECDLTGIDFYNANEDYRNYIDKVCAKHKITKEEAVELALSKEAEQMYRDKANNKLPKEIYY